MSKPIIDDYQLYFLSTTGEPPEWLSTFSQRLALYDIQVIVVTIDQLKLLSQHSVKVPVIYVEDSLRSKEWLQRKLRTYLGFLMHQRKLQLYHLSSFRELEGTSDLLKHGLYSFHRLPLNLLDLAEKVSDYYLKTNVETLKWPGGRRAKLPIGI